MSGESVQQIHAFAIRLLVALFSPFLEIFSRVAPIWWPFLLSGFTIAVAVFWFQNGRGAPALREFRRRFLGAAMWMHPSTHADYSFYLVNGVLYALIVGPLVVGGATIGRAVESVLMQLFGPIGSPVTGAGMGTVVYTIGFFIAYDFGRFVAHSLLHDIPLLWDFHKVHHSAEVLTPLTSYRVHPIDLLIMGSVPNVMTGLVTGVAWYLSGDQIGFHTFLGMHAGIALFNVMGNLRHWQVWISFGPELNRWLISPAHHQIHHSREERHIGMNRGFELAIWDRLWGTLYAPVREESFALGLGDGTDGAWHAVGRMYAWPFRDALTRLRNWTIRPGSRRRCPDRFA
jgi:sterol desaturase/sphingolipid hydroxylase (fatty acid hydroxylase superfamily)